jgi:hypothetical protein
MAPISARNAEFDTYVITQDIYCFQTQEHDRQKHLTMRIRPDGKHRVDSRVGKQTLKELEEGENDVNSDNLV